MAKQSLRSMSLSALVKLRGKVGDVISRRVDGLKRELRSLGEDYKEVGRIALYGKKKVKGVKRRRKVARKPAASSRRANPNTRKAAAKKSGKTRGKVRKG